MMKTELVIIGSGPAGCSAAIYAVRSGVQVTLLGGSIPGGQLLQTNDIENYAGFVDPVSGFEIMDHMHKQCKRLGVEILPDEVDTLENLESPFVVRTTSGRAYEAMAVIIATGAKARWLNIPGEERFKGKGLSACATCDGFFFKGKDVCVVGGGNTAFEDVLFLSQFCPNVYLVHRRDGFRADKITVDKVRNTPNIHMVLSSVIEEVLGDDVVTGARIRNVQTNTFSEIKCSGIFMAVGAVPQTDFLKDTEIKLSDSGLVEVDERTNTNIPGIFAAGDCADPHYRQAIIAAGSGAKAAIEASAFINLRK